MAGRGKAAGSQGWARPLRWSAVGAAPLAAAWLLAACLYPATNDDGVYSCASKWDCPSGQWCAGFSAIEAEDCQTGASGELVLDGSHYRVSGGQGGGVFAYCFEDWAFVPYCVPETQGCGSSAASLACQEQGVCALWLTRGLLDALDDAPVELQSYMYCEDEEFAATLIAEHDGCTTGCLDTGIGTGAEGCKLFTAEGSDQTFFARCHNP